MTLKIEKGVPVPQSRYSWKKYPLAEMEIGDSFVVPADNRIKNICSCISDSAKRLGIRLTTRKLKDGSFRVWRIE